MQTIVRALASTDPEVLIEAQVTVERGYDRCAVQGAATNDSVPPGCPEGFQPFLDKPDLCIGVMGEASYEESNCPEKGAERMYIGEPGNPDSGPTLTEWRSYLESLPRTDGKLVVYVNILTLALIDVIILRFGIK